MPNYPCSLHDVRKLLDRILDDSSMDAFCLDYFTEVYEQFGRGMQKQEKLNLLLSYHRTPERFELLLQVIYEHEHPEFKTFCANKGIQFTPMPSIQIATQTEPFYMAAQPHHFDMNELLTECLDCLLERQGLIGFVIFYNSPVFLRNLCERLKYEWGRGRIRLKPMVSIDPVHTPIDRAILTISQRYVPSLQESDILCAVQIGETHQIKKFWSSLSQAIAGKSLPNRLIIILGTNIAVDPLPGDLIPLTPPRFRRAHIHRWVRRVVEHFSWPEEVAQFWTQQMITECSHENELLIDWVYDHLEAIVDLLRQNPSIDQFQKELEKRRQMYVQTSS